MDEPVFDPSKLKKKKKVNAENANVVEESKSNSQSRIPQGTGCKSDIPTLYSYDNLLARIYKTNTVVEEKKIPYPILNITQGMAPSTYVKNFAAICIFLQREPRNVMNYMYLEIKPKKIGVNASGELWMRGKYEVKQIKTVLKNFIQEYVKCKACGSNDTRYEKNQGILFVYCKKCQAKKPVPKIPEPKFD